MLKVKDWQPIRTTMAPIALAAFVAAGQSFVAGADTRGIVVAVLGALILLAQEYARRKVVPVAKLEHNEVDVAALRERDEPKPTPSPKRPRRRPVKDNPRA
jgi:hypothetical protein